MSLTAPARSWLNRAAAGFTLIEILVALLLLALALLGFAAMLMANMRHVQAASYHTQAAVLANDMAERLRANAVGVAGGHYDALTGTSSDPGCITSAAGCTAAQLAQYDDWHWNQLIDLVLPQATGTVSRSGSTFSIAVSWTEMDASGPAARSLSLTLIP
jgi:type IV pilus assembly protein PilV